jgi:hypothetical protein
MKFQYSLMRIQFFKILNRIRIRIQLFFTLMRIRIQIQLLFKVLGISRLQFEPPGLHCERPRLFLEPLKLQSFDFKGLVAVPLLLHLFFFFTLDTYIHTIHHSFIKIR